MFKNFWYGLKMFLAGLFAEAAYFKIETKQTLKGAVGEVDRELIVTGKKLIHLWDEKRFFGLIYMLLALLLPFLFPALSVQILMVCAGLGLALLFGVPIGDSVPFVQGLQSLGLADLFTNKANRGDGFRTFGVLFQIAAITYLFAPLWNLQAQVVYENFLFLGGVGVVMSWGAIWGDHVAVKNQA